MLRKRRLDPGRKLEARLRAFRAEPRDEFVRNLAAEIGSQEPSSRRAWSRAAFAGAVSVFILGTLGSFGGLSYAASGAASTYRVAKQVAIDKTLFVSIRKSSASGQYAHKPKPKTHKHSARGVAGVQAAVAKPKGSLPFTGVSLLVTALLSLALVSTGLLLRRAERKRG
jgi:hypothetical protein